MAERSDEAGADARVRTLGFDGNADDELDVLLFGEGVEPVDKIAERCGRLVIDHLQEVVDKEMGNIVIAGVNAADQTLEEFIGADGIAGSVYETRLIRNVVRKLLVLFDDNVVAVCRFNCASYQVDQLFGLAGSLQTHDDLDQEDHAPFQ